jgi:opacity protein-like surface antigen
MKRILVASLVGATALIGGTAHAQDSDSKGVYIEGGVGIAAVSDTDITYYDDGGTFGGTGATDTAEFEVGVDNAVTFGGAIGYDFGMIRAELAVDYAKNDLESLTLTGINGAAVTLDEDDAEEVCDYLEIDDCEVDGNTFTTSAGGRVRQLSGMVNAWLDIPIGSVITPYVGGGIGIGGFETDGEGDAKFAWQLGAGVAVNLSSSLSLTANYRHREISGSTIEWDEVSGFEVGDLKTDAFTAGIRLTL